MLGAFTGAAVQYRKLERSERNAKYSALLKFIGTFRMYSTLLSGT